MGEQVEEMAAVRGCEPRGGVRAGRDLPGSEPDRPRTVAARSAAVVYFPTPQGGWSSTRSETAERRRSTAYPPYIMWSHASRRREQRVDLAAARARRPSEPHLHHVRCASSETSIILRSTLFT